MRKNSLLIVTPSLSFGGAEKVALILSNYFSELDIEVSLVSVHPLYGIKDQLSGKVNFYQLTSGSAKNSIFELRRLILKIRPDKIISVLKSVNILTAVSTFYIKPKPQLYFRVEAPLSSLVYPLNLKNIIYLFLLNITYPFALKVIPNSLYTLDTLKKYYLFGNNYSGHIGNPVFLEGDKTKTGHIKKSLKINGNMLILNVARLSKEKDHTTLVKSFSIIKKKLNNVKLIIIGRGPMERQLKSFIGKLKLENDIFILPTMSKITCYYDLADLFLFTSKYEGFGNVIVEALSRGLPVISTNCGSLPKELFKSNTSKYLAEIGDHKALANKSINILSETVDKSFYKKLVSKYKKSYVCGEYGRLMGLD
ncbi:MAG: hypothetical protein CMA12_01110 [Euryarchaeota archaeon]|nr:hypothetical protein [Euryarchaeota archaeon]|tara:strand:- start:1452 stop:2549 length:1098 start_codon:yes stop_codon:yes gene_type:complete